MAAKIMLSVFQNLFFGKRIKAHGLFIIATFLPVYGVADNNEARGIESHKVPDVVVSGEQEIDWAEYQTIGNGADIPVGRNVDPADPYEGVNRQIFKFNETIDEAFIEPVARGYRTVMPKYGRERVSNFMSNLSSPVVFFNDVLQGDLNQAFTTFWRFTINTTIGVGGMYDVAKQAGLESRDEDFGQTLGKYDVPNGPYIVIPLLGPSTARDAVGVVVDSVTNPVNYVSTPVTVGVKATDVVVTRESLLDEVDEIEKTSFDSYSAIKSAYLQYRADLVKNGNNKKNMLQSYSNEGDTTETDTQNSGIKEE